MQCPEAAIRLLEDAPETSVYKPTRGRVARNRIQFGAPWLKAVTIGQGPGEAASQSCARS